MRNALWSTCFALLGCSESGLLSSALCAQPCFTQSSATVGVGSCSYGRPVCNMQGVYVSCEDEVLPRLEVCDGQDNDCDGFTDEGFDSDQDGTADCFDNEECDGLDNDGDELVDEGFDVDGDGFAYCHGDCDETNPRINPGALELCDGLDNDCNGQVDDDAVTEGATCGLSDIGVCTWGSRTCITGEDFCPDAVLPENEVCDGLDNDCDGEVDEDVYRPCSSLCGHGLESCEDGYWVSCSAPTPSTEVCDGRDNDCDGEVDEGCSCIEGDAQSCTSGIIDRNMVPVSCGIGVTFCDNQGQWGPCWSVGTSAEICNGWDDDCDGVVDGQSVICGATPNAGMGLCRAGTSTCSAGQWTSCAGEVGPTLEVCDQEDNDCDGLIDEDLSPHSKVDIIFAIDWSGSMCSYIQALSQGISAYVQDFVGTDHRFGLLVFPGPGGATVSLQSAPVTVAQLVTVLSTLSCSGGGFEPSYDVVAGLADPADPFRIGWRNDAHPYVVLITDEPAQTSMHATESLVAQATNPCRVGGCGPGDRLEVFIITYTNYFPQWNDIVPAMGSNYLIDITPASATRYTELLQGVFTNVCR